MAIEPTHIPQRQLIAERFSTFAIVFAALNLMLSTRAGFLERWLRGLDKLFVTHRTIGLSVAFLVTAHFLLVPKSVGFVWSKPLGYATLALLLTAIFVASAPRFPWRRLVPLNYQTWKFSHRFMGALVALAVAHSLSAHTYVKTAPPLAAYVYGIAALGLAAWLYREFAFRYVGPFHVYDVSASRLLGRGVIEVMLDSSSSRLARSSGQFACVTFDSGPTREQHPFTISSGAGHSVRFSIKGSGDFTNALLSGVPDGSQLRIEGPYGAFVNDGAAQHQLWLAGGIGITPFLSMAEDLDDQVHVLLVWSVHDEQEAIYRRSLLRVAEEKPNLSVLVHSTSEHGHLDATTLDLEVEPGGYAAFICGPVPMRQALVRQLRSMGVARGRIHFEEFRLR